MRWKFWTGVWLILGGGNLGDLVPQLCLLSTWKGSEWAHQITVSGEEIPWLREMKAWFAEITVYQGQRPACFDAIPRLEMEKRLWCRSVQSHRGYSSSQAWNLFLQSHRVDSHVMNQDIGFQENAWYIALFTVALILLYKQEYAIFLIIWRTLVS